MKPLHLISVLFLAACNAPDNFTITGPNGITQQLTATPAMLGNKRTVLYSYKDAFSETKLAISQDNEKSFDSFVTAVTMLAATAIPEYFTTKQAEDVLQSAVSNNKIAAGLSKAEIDAGIKQAMINAGLSKTAIQHGVTVIPR